MNDTVIAHNTLFIKRKARELGFEYCGISKAEFLEEEARRLESWLNRGYHGKMQWMENHFDKRTDPRKLVEGAQSVISLMLNYFPEKEIEMPYKISKYAYGKDYHTVIKEKLKTFIQAIRDEIGDVHGRAFTDSAPVMDKVWAERSGLGWIGKNTNLINPKSGSFYFLAELIIDIELIYDTSIGDYCGTCTRCIDACPTHAITEPYVVDASKCISYLTIELKENIPIEFKNKMEGWIFGCDVCQDVCPWNRFSSPHKEDDFNPSDKLLQMTKSEWEEITEEVFKELFRHSAVKRANYEGLKRNISFVQNN